ncbi:uncharacterized protein LOC119675316 [Teleopsis dalmanni]|uniref:uncharacterized protein LOC119675316 n=1 Tax=Teleopsis dalmanni TaxID=139649 RepID=UPI0018CDFA3C|nr:uncharacterized protein LOC119675316 [Teleopsis dalmanni]
MHSATLCAFVGNRVSEIQDLTAGSHWRYVHTNCNPADIVSRGSTVKDLTNSIWFKGPSFLRQEMYKWPANKNDNLDFEEVNKEKRKAAFKVTVSTNYVIDIIDKYSSHTTAVRVLAWLFRWYHHYKKKFNRNVFTEVLTHEELDHAFRCIISNIQAQYFAEDIYLLNPGSITKGSLKYLNPFIEDTGGYKLIKVGGRLELADLAKECKHPILLPSKSEFVIRYVRYLHRKNYHAGPKALVALNRLEFWIINARELARRVVRQCVHCVHYKPKLLQQMMGNLPVERLTPSRPFARCGIDFCGPFNTYLRIRGKPPYKTYIAIFICMATKAVHIEVVSSLSTDAFIAALKRMIGRRGLPSDIFCDNATNFVGASNQLTELKSFLFNKITQSSIIQYCASEFINFHFIPPRAPRFGGLWEAAVKSAKGHLYRSLMTTKLTFEELSTVTTEIEAILNSRPLTPLLPDPSDYEALTPAHFLIRCSLKALPEWTEFANTNMLDKWSLIIGLKQSFWKRWSHEYINELQMRTKWTCEIPNIMPNAMVLIHEDNVPPLHWQLGRVLKVIPGKDEHVRVVDVRTSKGIIRKPIHKLAILPIESPFKEAGMLGNNTK